ncbi:MAG: type IV pilus twitching motility protein PilT [Lachnospiraceae bacterium]|jgi:twitching motility protein PilT|nr:type IV pilus twitching motility protein PilT [Lachnospiraceae bacterium]RKJ05216.1 type IV pilus twitching motility protein PilT [bacterium D16-54]RKJ15028.1 type IV pilus twitching motility protein PilT [bacterium D16-56]
MKIKEVLKRASEEGASDVHFTAGLPPKMRLSGSLVSMPYESLTGEDTMAAAKEIMSQEQFDHFMEKGEYDMSLSLKEAGRYRVNVFRQQGAAALAFRLVRSEIPSPEELGIPSSVIDLYNRKRGLILVTGPTGSGKSTTLASIIHKVNLCRDAHIITLEDPIEYVHTHKMSMVNQREIGSDTQSYANGLKAALREDPDVILVGEMRDYETISVAVTAAETGHLVLSTLHTIGAASTVDRIIDVFPPHQQQQIRVQLANVLEGIISQQLIPKADGRGRVGAFEVLHVNLAVRNLIREGKTHQLPSIMQTGRRQGMMTMDEAIIQLVRDRKITPQMALSFAQDRDSMERVLP